MPDGSPAKATTPRAGKGRLRGETVDNGSQQLQGPVDGTALDLPQGAPPVAVAVSRTRPSSRTRPARRGLILALFVGSGAAGLVYQVVWSRELVLVFGNTTQAVSTIVTAFMAGLGFGSLAGGRWARRSARPLRLYGSIELGVAVLAISLPFAFDDLAELYRGAYPSLVDNTLALTAVRFALALAAVAPATFLMGATLPLLVRHLVRTLDEAGARLGELYAANTAGAVAGTVIAGFVLIEFLGLRLTSYLAVALNLIAGSGALLLSRLADRPTAPDSGRAEAIGGDSRRDDLDLAVDRGTPPASEGSRLAAIAPARSDGEVDEERGGRLDDDAHPDPAGSRLAPRWAILLATFVSGFVSLALEVLWTRMLSEGTGSSIYIFTTILAIFLAGIAIGSAIYRRWSTPSRERAGTLGVCLAVVGALAQATVVLGGLNLLAGAALLAADPTWRRRAAAGFPTDARPSGTRVVAKEAPIRASTSLAHSGTDGRAAAGGGRSALGGSGDGGTAGRRWGPGRARVGAVAFAALALLGLVASSLDLPVTRTATENRLRALGLPVTHA